MDVCGGNEEDTGTANPQTNDLHSADSTRGNGLTSLIGANGETVLCCRKVDPAQLSEDDHVSAISSMLIEIVGAQGDLEICDSSLPHVLEEEHPSMSPTRHNCPPR